MKDTGKRLVYSVAEACAMIDKSRSSLYAAIRAGEIQTFKDGSRRKISARALAEYTERLEQGRAAA